MARSTIASSHTCRAKANFGHVLLTRRPSTHVQKVHVARRVRALVHRERLLVGDAAGRRLQLDVVAGLKGHLESTSRPRKKPAHQVGQAVEQVVDVLRVDQPHVRLAQQAPDLLLDALLGAAAQQHRRRHVV